MKRKILVVYSQMIVGGSTTSLLGLLNALDYTTFDVDLLLLEPGGPLVGRLPNGVNIIHPGSRGLLSGLLGVRRRYISPRYLVMWCGAYVQSRRLGNILVRSQFLAEEIASLYERPGQEYDVAVAFLEFTPVAFVANRVSAKRKVAWLHVDYREAGLLPVVEERRFREFADIVLVSEASLEHFRELYPSCADRSHFVENVLDEDFVRQQATSGTTMSLECPDVLDFSINLVSNSRIDFACKGHDRAARALRRLVGDKRATSIHWWIIGDGRDMDRLERIIAELGLEPYVSLLGSQDNPFPVLAQMDVFFMPSVFEGKPMAVTEAQILGLPVFATRYASAQEQVCNEVDGVIVPNTEEGIYRGLRRFVDDPLLLPRLANGAKNRRASQEDGRQAILNLLSGTGRS